MVAEGQNNYLKLLANQQTMRGQIIEFPEDSLQIAKLPDTEEAILRETVEDLRISWNLQTDGDFVVKGIESDFY